VATASAQWQCSACKIAGKCVEVCERQNAGGQCGGKSSSRQMKCCLPHEPSARRKERTKIIEGAGAERRIPSVGRPRPHGRQAGNVVPKKARAIR